MDYESGGLAWPVVRLSRGDQSLAHGFDLVGDCIRMLLLARCSNRGCSVRRGVG